MGAVIIREEIGDIDAGEALKATGGPSGEYFFLATCSHAAKSIRKGSRHERERAFVETFLFELEVSPNVSYIRKSGKVWLDR